MTCYTIRYDDDDAEYLLDTADDFAAVLLVQAVIEIERLGEGNAAKQEWACDYACKGREWSNAYLLCHHGVPYCPSSWISRRYSARLRMGFHRALKHLESKGLVLRVAVGSSRTNRYRLTRDGLAAALAIDGAYPDPDNLKRGLGLTTWGEAEWVTDADVAALAAKP